MGLLFKSRGKLSCQRLLRPPLPVLSPVVELYPAVSSSEEAQRLQTAENQRVTKKEKTFLFFFFVQFWASVSPSLQINCGIKSRHKMLLFRWQFPPFSLFEKCLPLRNIFLLVSKDSFDILSVYCRRQQWHLWEWRGGKKTASLSCLE